MVPAIALAAVAATSIAPPAALNLAEWLGPQNYPVIPLEFGLQGFTQADVYIDELGQPKACYVIVSSGVDQLDSQTCAAAMHRGKFTPAHDDAGVTMPGMYRFRVTWALDRRSTPAADVTLSVARLPAGVSSAIVQLRYIVDETGAITRCEVDVSSGTPALDAAACRTMPGRYRFAPAQDGAGVAHRVVRTQSVGFEVARK